jgi:hypothetical protein
MKKRKEWMKEEQKERNEKENEAQRQGTIKGRKETKQSASRKEKEIMKVQMQTARISKYQCYHQVVYQYRPLVSLSNKINARLCLQYFITESNL